MDEAVRYIQRTLSERKSCADIAAHFALISGGLFPPVFCRLWPGTGRVHRIAAYATGAQPAFTE